jgi:MscS family membrane protein
MNEFFAREFYYNTVGQWAISLAIIVGTLVAAKIVYWVFGKIMKKLTSKTKTRLDDLMVDMLEEPIVLVITIAGVWFALNRMTFPDKMQEWINTVYWVIITLTVAWLIARLVDALIKEYVVPLTQKTEGDLDDQIIPILRKAIRATIWILGIVIALNNAGYNIGALLAGLGIGGLALAMAAKDTVANIFGGITIFTDKPFKINDRVKIGGFDGTITEIGIRSTRLKTLENRIVTIPNSKFTDGMVENVSSEPHRKVVLKLGVTYDTTAEKIQDGMKALQAIVDETDTLEENSVISFTEFGDSALGILFIYYIKKGDDIMGSQTVVNMEIKKRFEALEIDMAFPTQTVYTIAEKQD